MFGNLYEIFNYEDQYSILFYTFFCLRRLAFVYIMRLKIWGVRTNLSLHLQVLWLCYLIRVKPHINRQVANLYLFNEAIFFVSLCIIPCYTNILPKSEQRQLLGWIHSAVIGILLLVNMVYMVSAIIRNRRNQYRKKRAV